MNTKINKLFIGKPKTFKKPGLQSAINKNEVNLIQVTKDSIEGDEVSNKKYHGGTKRVLHFYPSEHYNFFKDKFNSDVFHLGTIGENISTSGLNEKNVHVGDIYKIGEVICQITEPRFPCGLIDLQYSIKGMHKECLFERRLGWFAQILNEGKILNTDNIELIERPFPNLSLDKCIEAINEDGLNDTLELMIKNEILSESWKNKAEKKRSLLERL